MKDLPHHTMWVHLWPTPTALALPTTVLNFRQLQQPAAMIMVALPTINPPQVSALQVLSIRAAPAAGHHGVPSATPVQALPLIHRLRLTHRPLQIWVWPAQSTTHRLGCRRPVLPSPLPRQRTVQRLQALAKPVLLRRLRSTHPLLQASPQPHQDIHRRRRSILQRHQRSALPRQRRPPRPHTARRLQAGVRRRQLMPVLPASRPRLLHHNTRRPHRRSAPRRHLSVRRLRLIRLLVRLSILLRGVRVLLRARSIRPTAQRVPNTLRTHRKTIKLRTRPLSICTINGPSLLDIKIGVLHIRSWSLADPFN